MADTDGDGWDDYTEYIYSSAVDDAGETPDDDGDGLYLPYELAQGSDPDVVDTDGDGWDDYTEYIYATDPLDPTSHI